MDPLQPKHETFTDSARGPDHGATSEMCELEEFMGHSTHKPRIGTEPTTDRVHILNHGARKRKIAEILPVAELPNSKRVQQAGQDDQKKLDDTQHMCQSAVSRVPAEVWHYIFTFVPPRTLGHLMLVNKQFNSYLDALSEYGSAKILSSYTTYRLPKLEPGAIWRASRRLFWPRMPAALEGRSELEMWRLCCSQACQFCKARDQSNAGTSEDRWRRGPGPKGVFPVFAFFVVSCSRCLSKKCTVEIDLLLSSSIPSALLPGLPMVFLTQEDYVVPTSILASSSISSSQPRKVFFNDHIDNIKCAFEEAKKYGTAAAKEWIKGLGPQGQRTLADVARWERWHLAGGLEDMRRPDPIAFEQSVASSQVLGIGCSPDSSRLARSRLAKSSFGVKSSKTAGNSGHKESPSQHHGFQVSVLTDLSSQPSTKAESVGAASISDISISGHKPKLISKKAETLKAARWAEIGRRANSLQPPIPLNVLAHMPAFQAALRSTIPLDDNQWQALQPLFLTQLKEAEMKEEKSQSNIKSTARTIATTQPPGPLAGAKVTDADWNQAQGSLRGEISKFADEIIQKRWKGTLGQKLTKKNAPQFAADVLLYVRKKFYTQIAKHAKADKVGLVSEPPEGPWSQKLTLENMRWIFDVKIKPLINHFRKEVFLCNGCEGATKFYGFDGVVQHYASKHTNTLSLGNAVVHWKAEWPEIPIFKASSQHRTRPHTKTKNKTLDVYFSRLPGPPGSVAEPSDSKRGYCTPNSAMTMSTNHGADIQSASCHHSHFTSELSAEQAYTVHAPLLHELRTSPAEFYAGNSYKMMGTLQNADDGRSSISSGRGNLTKALGRKGRLEHVATVANQTWQKLVRAKRLDNSVRVCAVVHFIAKSFQKKYSEPAPLKLFIDALKGHNSMAKLGSIAGLACKACKLDPCSPLQTKTYSLAKLSRHFDGSHSGNATPLVGKPLDWRVDMIWLPDVPTLMTLRTVIGNDKEVLDVVADTLPWAFEPIGHCHGAPGTNRSYDAAGSASGKGWQQPSAIARETFGCKSERTAAPRLELDGLEIIEQPGARPDWGGHDRIRGGFCTEQLQEHTTPPIAASGCITHPEYGAYPREDTYPAQTNLARGDRHNTTHWASSYEIAHSHTPRPTHSMSHGRSTAESYKLVEMRDPHGVYRITRPLRREYRRDTLCDSRGQPYTLPHDAQHQHNYDNYSGGRSYASDGTPRRSGCEEYDPRFPAAGWKR
ncbi:F-box domain containing protein [Metarhizium rileyi]|uniref:F-box domain containing protein n=1 Tax=Metarhizium rileyi (strain RCEF 4871) TaxID=1649241 RepID=A0A167B5V3_METRR|nr:F-box domain containing protein [Metarhizium rileyi RCEF 4871]